MRARGHILSATCLIWFGCSGGSPDIVLEREPYLNNDAPFQLRSFEVNSRSGKSAVVISGHQRGQVSLECLQERACVTDRFLEFDIKDNNALRDWVQMVNDAASTTECFESCDVTLTIDGAQACCSSELYDALSRAEELVITHADLLAFPTGRKFSEMKYWTTGGFVGLDLAPGDFQEVFVTREGGDLVANGMRRPREGSGLQDWGPMVLTTSQEKELKDLVKSMNETRCVAEPADCDGGPYHHVWVDDSYATSDCCGRAHPSSGQDFERFRAFFAGL